MAHSTSDLNARLSRALRRADDAIATASWFRLQRDVAIDWIRDLGAAVVGDHVMDRDEIRAEIRRRIEERKGTA